jgi:hypothetical protein
MKKSLVGLARVAAVFGAGAQTLSLDSPDAYSFTGFNASGYAPNSFTSELFVTVLVSGPARVTYEYMGSESGYNTSLFARYSGGASGLVTESAGSRSVGTVTAGGILDFSFRDGVGSPIHNSSGFRDDADFDGIVARVSVSPIPEPSTYALMLARLAAVGFAARRRRAS